MWLWPSVYFVQRGVVRCAAAACHRCVGAPVTNIDYELARSAASTPEAVWKLPKIVVDRCLPPKTCSKHIILHYFI